MLIVAVCDVHFLIAVTFITYLPNFIPEEMLFIRCMWVMASSARVLHTTSQVAVYLIKTGHCALVAIHTLTYYFICAVGFAFFMTIAAFLLFKWCVQLRLQEAPSVRGMGTMASRTVRPRNIIHALPRTSLSAFRVMTPGTERFPFF